MYRRHLIKLAAYSLLGLLVPAGGLRPLHAHTVFQNMFGDDRIAAQLGKLYQRQDPSAGARGRSLAAKLAAMRSSARQDYLQMRSQADLAALDIVTIDGWVMARSEADLCAAVHLDRSAA